MIFDGVQSFVNVSSGILTRMSNGHRSREKGTRRSLDVFPGGACEIRDQLLTAYRVFEPWTQKPLHTKSCVLRLRNAGKSWRIGWGSLLVVMLLASFVLMSACGGSSDNSSGSGTCTTVPGAPTGLAGSNTTSSGTTLNWTAPTGLAANCSVTGYTIYENGSSIGTSTTPNFKVTGLSPSTAYSFNVAASDAAGLGAQSSAASVTTGAAGSPEGTTTNLVSSQNPANVGQAVTFTASVTPQSSGTVTGNVVFYSGGTELGEVPLSGGTASLTTTTLAGGTHSITATYTGTTDYASSTSSVLSEVVDSGSGTCTTVPGAPTGLAGSNTTSSGTTLNWTAPTGLAANCSVTGYTIYENGASIGTSTTPNFNVTGLSPSTTYSFNVAAGDAAGLGAQSSTASVTTGAAGSPEGTTTNLVSSQNPANVGQAVTFTASVTPQSSGTVTGNVVFYSGSTELGEVPLSGGTASLTTTTLAGGTHSITATYTGTTDYASSTSSVLSEVVDSGSGTCTTVPGAPTGLAGSNTTSSGTTLNWTAPTGLAANCSVTGYTIYENGASIGTSTTPNFNVTGLSPSTTYSFNVAAGDAAGLGAQSSTASVTTGAAGSPEGTTTNLVSSQNPANVGQAVTFTASVTPQSSGTVTGNVVFYSGSTELGEVPLSGGTASLTTTTLAGGTHSITATYTGTTDYASSTSSVLSEVVDSGSGTCTTVPGAPTGLAGSNTTSSGTTLNWTAPTGLAANCSVTGYTIYENGASIGASTTPNFNVTGLSPSTTYSFNVAAGDAAGLGAQSSAASVTTGAAGSPEGTTTNLISSQNPANVGQAVTFTASVTPQSSGTVTGNVVFYSGSTELGEVPLSGGTASLATTLTGGTHSITATYTGTTDYARSTSSVLSESVDV